MRLAVFGLCVWTLVSCSEQPTFDILIRNGIVYDGKGGDPYQGDIGINADTIAFIGDLEHARGRKVIDAKGLAVAPGFINMLSWANETLIADGRSESDIRQGVTLEVMGEGESMGPWTENMKYWEKKAQNRIRYEIEWSTLGEYLNFLERKGISCNVASFVGATTIRACVIGEENRPPSVAELDSMRYLVRQAMEEGALGVGSSLIYAPAFFADTDELIALCEEAAKYGGMYISHLRSEGERLEEAVEELITISRTAKIPAEIYHLKAAGRENWHKMDRVIARINEVRKEGLKITADMYLYTAGSTGLTATMPPGMQDGGFGRLVQLLKQRDVRLRLKKEMNEPSNTWENFYRAVGSPDKILLVGFQQDSLKKYTGKSLAEIASIRGTSPEETAMDLVVQDSSRVTSIYFLMDEENLRKQVSLPWMSFGSDAGSYVNEGLFLDFHPHPRAYGNFARLLGTYVRDEKRLTLQDAIRQLTHLPATNLKIKRRGELVQGYYADLVIFDPARIHDRASYEQPHRYAEGMMHVIVNGTLVLEAGKHTGAKPGRFVKGPGYRRNKD